MLIMFQERLKKGTNRIEFADKQFKPQSLRSVLVNFIHQHIPSQVQFKGNGLEFTHQLMRGDIVTVYCRKEK